MKDKDTSTVVGFNPIRGFVLLASLAIGGLVGAGLVSQKADSREGVLRQAALSTCKKTCVDNTYLFITALLKKGQIDRDHALRMVEGFDAKCGLDCNTEFRKNEKR